MFRFAPWDSERRRGAYPDHGPTTRSLNSLPTHSKAPVDHPSTGNPLVDVRPPEIREKNAQVTPRALRKITHQAKPRALRKNAQVRPRPAVYSGHARARTRGEHPSPSGAQTSQAAHVAFSTHMRWHSSTEKSSRAHAHPRSYAPRVYGPRCPKLDAMTPGALADQLASYPCFVFLCCLIGRVICLSRRSQTSAP